MKAPMVKMAMPMPTSGNVKGAEAAFPMTALFAHHAPTIQKRPSENPRMMRPHGGNGPHNPMEK